MNIILDTNAYKYLYNIYYSLNVPNNWYGYSFDKDAYQNFCYKADNIFLTSETLYELFLQSLKNNGSLTAFIDQYIFFHKIKERTSSYGSIMNCKNGMYFDMEEFAYCINNSKTLDFNKYLDTKINVEHTTLMFFIKALLTTTCNTLHELTGDKVYVNPYISFLESCYSEISNITSDLYARCYIRFEIGKDDFSKYLDIIMKDIYFNLYNLINSYAADLTKNSVPCNLFNANDQLGVDYLKKFLIS